MSSKDQPRASHKFLPDRGNIIAAVLMAAISLMIIPWAPAILIWVLIVPAVIIYWALRARTVVTDDGVTITYAFRGGVSATWAEITGISFKGARTYLHTESGGQHHLPGVTFNSLPRLEEASRGRIPDAITASHEDADGKMEVIDRNGNRVLLTQEEYRRHVAEREAAQNAAASGTAHDEGSSTARPDGSTPASPSSQPDSESKE